MTTASSEEVQRQISDVQKREEALKQNREQLQADIETLQEQQKDLATRQAIYNQQQMEFVTRKNALSAQQFEFSDKLAAYNAQVKLFNENLEKLEAEQADLKAERTHYEEQLSQFKKEKQEFEDVLAKFNEEKKQVDQERINLRKQSMETESGLHAKISELDSRERSLLQRERELNEHIHEFNVRQLNNPAYTAGNGNGYANQPPYAETPQQNNPYRNPHSSNNLYARAQVENIKLNTVNMQEPAPQQTATTHTNNVISTRKQSNSTTYNVGQTLYKSALIMFCIVAFESLIVFFLKDMLQVSPAYPAIGFGIGFLAFLVCVILYAYGFRPHARRKKHPSYILTLTICFVIAVIAVTMVAVYSQAQMSNPAQLCKYVIVPVAYLANILVFALFYYLFSKREND
jgi:hypothetical protein